MKRQGAVSLPPGEQNPISFGWSMSGKLNVIAPGLDQFETAAFIGRLVYVTRGLAARQCRTCLATRLVEMQTTARRGGCWQFW